MFIKMDGVCTVFLAVVVLIIVDVSLGQRPVVGVCPGMRPSHCGGVNFALDDEPLPKDCQDVYDKGKTMSGVYTVFPNDIGFCAPVRVYCDMEDGGGWTVFQRRQDGSEDFYLGWASYRIGFGNLAGEFWLGNNHLYRLTNQDKYVLRVDLEDNEGEKRHALFSGFSVGDEGHHYPLRIGEFLGGEAGDSFSTHDGQTFQTRDRETGNCAYTNQGAWWYRYCGQSSPNGLYPETQGNPYNRGRGIYWASWHGTSYSFPYIQMKFRPIREEDMPEPTEAMMTEDEGSGMLAATRAPAEKKNKDKKGKKDKSGKSKPRSRGKRSDLTIDVPWDKN